MKIRDLDRDGRLTPVLVLRFLPWDGDGADRVIDGGPFAGRLEIVLFRGGERVAIRAVTGMLDDERRTTATDSFFALPAAQQRWQEQLPRDWTQRQVFISDDNGGRFAPHRGRPPRPR